MVKIQISSMLKLQKDIGFDTIAEIKNSDGVILVDHQQKAAAFWQSFKNRMGITIPTV